MSYKNCVVDYTLNDSESSRKPLENALESDGWEKTEDHQTRWTGFFDDSKFTKTKPNGKKYWDDKKIETLFLSYFHEVKDDESVDATFVLRVGNSKDYRIDVFGITPHLSAYGHADQ